MTFVETKKKKYKQKKNSMRIKKEPEKIHDNRHTYNTNHKNRQEVPNYLSFCMMSNIEIKNIEKIDDECWKETYNRLNNQEKTEPENGTYTERSENGT